MEPQSSFKNLGIIMSVLVLLGVGGTIFYFERGVTTPAVIPPPVATVPPPIDNPKKITSIYKDGTYSATGSYMSPGGQDQIAVTLTLKNDIITDVTAVPQAGDRTSARYQAKFMAGYKQYVVGKNIADVTLSVVSGSSLTPIGFNAALAAIKTQAKV